MIGARMYVPHCFFSKTATINKEFLKIWMETFIKHSLIWILILMKKVRIMGRISSVGRIIMYHWYAIVIIWICITWGEWKDTPKYDSVLESLLFNGDHSVNFIKRIFMQTNITNNLLINQNIMKEWLLSFFLKRRYDHPVLFLILKQKYYF